MRTRRPVWSLAVVPILAAVSAACAFGTTDEPKKQAWTLETYCDARANAECAPQVVTRCGVASPEACVKARNDRCTLTAPQGVTLRPPKVDSCVKAIQDAYVDAKLTTIELQAMRTQCDAIWSGHGQIQDKCASDLDCDVNTGLSCIIPLDQTTQQPEGRCLRAHVVLAGDACPSAADVCEPSAYCDKPTTTCVMRKTLSQSCNPWTAPCAEGLECPGGGPFGSGCRAKKAAGDSCGTDTECADGMCVKAVKQAEGTCAKELALSPLDSVCASFKIAPSTP
jgi:hypothetical protein